MRLLIAKIFLIVICQLCDAGILETTDSAIGFAHHSSDNNGLTLLNNGGCGISCSSLDSLGPPPDAILIIPPPPVPSFLQAVLHINKSDCNLCHLFGSNYQGDSAIPLPSGKIEDTWIPMLIIVAVSSSVIGAALMIFVLKCKKWKIFPVAADSCPILPESFHSHKQSSSVPSKAAEETAQKVKDFKQESLNTSSKYLQCGSSKERHLYQGGSPHAVRNIEDYSAQKLSGNNLGSHVYAELESMSHQNMVSGISKAEIFPYATLSSKGVGKAVKRVDSLQNPIKDGAYDNEAFLPSEGNKSPSVQHKPRMLNHSTPRFLSRQAELNPNQSTFGMQSQKKSGNENFHQESKLIKKMPTQDYKNDSLKYGGKINSAVLGSALIMANSKSVKAELQRRPLPPLPKDHV